ADPEPMPSVTAIVIWSGESPFAKLPSAHYAYEALVPNITPFSYLFCKAVIADSTSESLSL
ncbi:14630_t:CDS:2, partial [Funneliformis mosseae]